MPYAHHLYAALQHGGSAALESLLDPDSEVYPPHLPSVRVEDCRGEEEGTLKLACAIKALSPCPTGAGPLQALFTAVERLRDSIYPLRALVMPATHDAAPCTPQFSAVCEASALAFEALAGVDFSASATPTRELCAEVLSVAACCTSLHLCARSYAACCSGRPRGVWRGALQGRVLESLTSSAGSGLFHCEDLRSIVTQTSTYVSVYQRLARASGCDEQEEGLEAGGVLALPPPLTQGAALCVSTTTLLMALRSSVAALDWVRVGAVLQGEGAGESQVNTEGGTVPIPHPPSPHHSYLSLSLSLWKDGKVAQCAVDELFFSALCVDRVRLAGLAGSCDSSLGVEAKDQHWEGVLRAATSVESTLHQIEVLFKDSSGSDSSSSSSSIASFSWVEGVSKVVLESKARASVQALLATLPITALHGRAGSLSAPVVVQEGLSFVSSLAHLEAVIEGAQRGLSSAGLNCSSPLLRSAWLVHSLRSLLLSASPSSPSSPLVVIGQCSPAPSTELACVEGILSRVMREEGVEGVMRSVGVRFDPVKEGGEDGSVCAKELHPAIVDEVCLLISTIASHRSSIALAAAICNPGTTPLVEALEAAHLVVTALPAHLKALVAGSRGERENSTLLGASGLTPPPLLPSLTLTSLLRLGAVVLQCRAALSIAQAAVTSTQGGLPLHQLPTARLGLEEALGVGVDKGVVVLPPTPTTSVTLPLSVASTLPVDVVASAERELGGVRAALGHMVVAEALQKALGTGNPTFKPGTMVLQWGGEGDERGEEGEGVGVGGGARYAAGILSALVVLEEGRNGGATAMPPLPQTLCEQLEACKRVATLASAVGGQGGPLGVGGEVEDVLRTWPFSSPPPPSLVTLSQHIIHTSLTQGLQGALYNDVTASVCGAPGALRLTNVSPTPLLTALGSLRFKGPHVPLTDTTLALARVAHTLAALRACTLFEVAGLGESDSLGWAFEEGAKVVVSVGGGEGKKGGEQEGNVFHSSDSLILAMREEINVILLDREARRVDGTLLAWLEGGDINDLDGGAELARAALLSPPNNRTPSTPLLLSTLALFHSLTLESQDPWCCVNILRRVMVAGVGVGGGTSSQPSLFPCGDLPTPPSCLTPVLVGGYRRDGGANSPAGTSVRGDEWEGMVGNCREKGLVGVSSTIGGPPITTLPLHPAFLPKLRTRLYSALIKVCDMVLPTLLSHLPRVASSSTPTSSLPEFSSCASWVAACLAACGGVTSAYLVPHSDRAGYVRVRDTMRVANLLRDGAIAGGLGHWEVSCECLFQAVGVLGPIKEEGKPPPATPLHPYDTLHRLLQCPVEPSEYPPLHASSTTLFKHLQECWSTCLSRAAVSCALTLRVGGEGEGGAQHLIRAAIGALSHCAASSTTTPSFSVTQLLTGLLEGGGQWCGARSLLARGDKGGALDFAQSALTHFTTSIPPIANWPFYLGGGEAVAAGCNSPPTPTPPPLFFLEYIAHVREVSNELLNDLVGEELGRCLVHASEGAGKGVGDFPAAEQRIQGWMKGGGGLLTTHNLECLRACKALYIMGGGDAGGGDYYTFIKGLTFPSPWIAAAGKWVEGCISASGGGREGDATSTSNNLPWALREIETAMAVNEMLGCGWEIERWVRGEGVGGDVGSLHLPTLPTGFSISSTLSRALASVSALERLAASTSSGGSSSTTASTNSLLPPALLPHIAHASTLRTAFIPLATALAHLRDCAARVAGSSAGESKGGGLSRESLEGALKASTPLLPPSPLLHPTCSPWLHTTTPLSKEAHLVSMHCQYLGVLSHLEGFCNGGIVASGALCIEDGTTLLARLEGESRGSSATSSLTLSRALHCATLLKRVHHAESVESLWGMGEELGLPCDAGAGGRCHTTLHQLLTSSLATPPFSRFNPTQHTHRVLTQGKLFALDVQCAMVVWASLMEWCKVGLCGGLQLPHLLSLGGGGEEGKEGWVEGSSEVTPLPLQQIIALATAFSDSPLLQQPSHWVTGGLLTTARAIYTLQCNWGGVGSNPTLMSELEGVMSRGEGLDWRGCCGWGRFTGIMACASSHAPPSSTPSLPLPLPLLSVCTHALLSARLYTALEGLVNLVKDTPPSPLSSSPTPTTTPSSASWEGLDAGRLRAGTLALEEGVEAMRASLSSPPPTLSSSCPPHLLATALHQHSVDTHPDALCTLEFIESTLGVRKAVLETEAWGVEAAAGCEEKDKGEGGGPSFSTSRPSVAPLTRALARLEALCSSASPGLKCVSAPGAALAELARTLAAQECLLASCCLRCATLERGSLRVVVTEGGAFNGDAQSLQATIARHHTAHASALSLGGPLTPWAERLLFTSAALLPLRQALLDFVAAKGSAPVGGPLSAMVTHHLPLSPLLCALYECRRGAEEGFFLPSCTPEVDSTQGVFEDTVFGGVMVPILEGRVEDGSDVGEMVEALARACEVSGAPPAMVLSHSALTTLSAARVASALFRAKASGDPQTMMQALGTTVAAESSKGWEEEREGGDTHVHSHLLSFALTSLTTQVEALGALGNLEAALRGMPCSDGCVGVSWAVVGEVGGLMLGGTPGGEHGTGKTPHSSPPFDPTLLATTPLALEAAIMEAGAILAALPSHNSPTLSASAATPLSSLLPLARAVLGLRKGVLSYLSGAAGEWLVAHGSVVDVATRLPPSPLTAYSLSEAHLCMEHGRYLSHLAALECALDEGGEEGRCTHALQIPIPLDAAATFLEPLLQFPAALPHLSPLPTCPHSISLPDLSRVWEGGMAPSPTLHSSVSAAQGFLESGVCPPGGLAWRTLHPLLSLATTLGTARRGLAQGLYEEVLQGIEGALGSPGWGVGGLDGSLRGVRELYLIRELALGVLERIKAAQALSALLASPPPHHTHPEPLLDALAKALSIGLPFDPVLTDGEHAQLFTVAMDRLCVYFGGVGYTSAAWVSEHAASGGGSGGGGGGGGVARAERGRRAGRTHL